MEDWTPQPAPTLALGVTQQCKTPPALPPMSCPRWNSPLSASNPTAWTTLLIATRALGRLSISKPAGAVDSNPTPPPVQTPILVLYLQSESKE